MTTPLAETLAAVVALNDPARPFTYEVDGTTIVGKWDIAKAQAMYPAEFETIDERYEITVTFDAGRGTFGFTERKSSNKESASGLGNVRKDSYGEPAADPIVWTFATSQITVPLFRFLKQHGWKRKNGLLGGLFNR